MFLFSCFYRFCSSFITNSSTIFGNFQSMFFDELNIFQSNSNRTFSTTSNLEIIFGEKIPIDQCKWIIFRQWIELFYEIFHLKKKKDFFHSLLRAEENFSFCLYTIFIWFVEQFERDGTSFDSDSDEKSIFFSRNFLCRPKRFIEDSTRSIQNWNSTRFERKISRFSFSFDRCSVIEVETKRFQRILVDSKDRLNACRDQLSWRRRDFLLNIIL